jgi:putative SOS response-associated peptidase YedK
MCYDLSFKTSIKTIQDYFPEMKIDGQLKFDFDYPHVLAQAFAKFPVVIFEDATYKLKNFEWGLIADYMNSPEKIKQGRQWMCNAQSEKIFNDKKSYWHRIRRERCLIPVTGIYEHREIKGWKNKVPYYVWLKGREMFCLPGLYHYAPQPDPETGEMIGTFTLLTRAANSRMRLIHNAGSNAFRMPLFLTKELEQKWLLPGLSDSGIEEILNFEMPAEQLEYRTVFSIRSRNPRPDQKEKYELYEWPDLPDLA